MYSFSFTVRYITLQTQGLGRSDKSPVLSHHSRTTCEKGTLIDMDAVLPRPCVHLCTSHREPVTFFRLRISTVSLCGTAPVPAYARVGTTECLLISTESIPSCVVDVNRLSGASGQTQKTSYNGSLRTRRPRSLRAYQASLWLPFRQCSSQAGVTNACTRRNPYPHHAPKGTPHSSPAMNGRGILRRLG